MLRPELISYAQVHLSRGQKYLPQIIDRLNSYEAGYGARDDRHIFTFTFGRIEIDTDDHGYHVSLRAHEDVGLHRLKDLAAVAIKLYTREEAPEIVWQGRNAGEQVLPQFRLMHVVSSYPVTPHMLRIRLAGDDLKRFSLFGAMHVRLLLPTPLVPEPTWPIMGSDGLPFWPNEARKPAFRAYTIRNLDIDAGWLEIDFYLHEVEGLACQWARSAKAGDAVGIMGPVGRPLRRAKNYIIGADATGLPAVARMLEEFASDVTGRIVVTADSEKDIQPLPHPEGINIDWIIDADQNRAAHALTNTLCALSWPETNDSFGWFAGEAGQAKIIRKHWREKLGKTRNETLVAGYWQKAVSGFMAG